MSVEKLNNITDEMKNKLTAETLTVKDLTSNGVTLRIGGKVVRLVVDETSSLSAEDEVRSELQGKLKLKLNSLADFIDKKMSEAFSIVGSLQSEYQRKEKLLNDKLARSNPMPQISWEQAQRGISVIPDPNGGVGWLIRKTYWPKFIDNEVIDPKYQKKMITPVVIHITTHADIIKEITVRKSTNLEHFDHYHRNCWGNWSWSKIRVTSAEDALVVADQAISVLERINTMSIARRTPTGLPRLDTLRRNALTGTTVPQSVTDDVVSRNLARTGVAVGANEDVWSVGAAL